MTDRHVEALQKIASISAFECDADHGATFLFFLASKMRKIALEALEAERIDHDSLITIEHCPEAQDVR